VFRKKRYNGSIEGKRNAQIVSRGMETAKLLQTNV
jgi:hypothetical protein